MEPTTSFHSPPPSQTRPGESIATLSNLPLEIKSLIVDKIAERDKQGKKGKKGRKGRKRTEEGELSPVQAISAVSRGFAALAQSHLWGSIDLESFHTHDLPHFLASILPRHALHIRHLHIARLDYDYDEDAHFSSDDELDDSDAEAVVRGRIEAMDDPFFASQLALLLTQAIRGMTRLSSVRCDLFQLADAFRTLWGEAEGPAWTGRSIPALRRASSVACALVDIGLRLRNLELTGDVLTGVDRVAFDYTEGRLAAFVSGFPSLSRLSLEILIRAAGRHSFIATLASLCHLRTLETTYSNLVTEEFATVPWVCPLKTLSLTEDFLPLPSLFKFLANFSTTLKTLTLDEVYSLDRDPLPVGLQATTHASSHPFPLPHLHTLNVFPTSERAQLLQEFTLCPIKYLAIHYTSYLTLTAWNDFLRSHLSTLKRVTVYYGEGSPVEPLVWQRGSPFRELCVTRGIECRLEQIAY